MVPDISQPTVRYGFSANTMKPIGTRDYDTGEFMPVSAGPKGHGRIMARNAPEDDIASIKMYLTTKVEE